MDDAEWMARTARILSHREAGLALEEVADTLLAATHARVAVRVNVRVIADVPAVELSVHSRGDAVPDEVWRRESLDGDHPFPRYYGARRDRRPRSLDQVRAAGFELTSAAMQRMRRLGVTEHQLACPIGGTPEAYHGWTFLSDDPYTELDVERVTARHQLIIGLDRHTQRLAQGPGQAPEPDNRRDPVLTRSEARVLAMMHAGLTAPAMGKRLGVSPRTVHKHQERIYRKLDATDRLTAVLAAKRLRLLPDHRLDDVEPAESGVHRRAGAG